jgi:hypothetical protein
MSDPQTKKTPGKKPAGKAKPPSKPSAKPSAGAKPSAKEGGKSNKLDAVKKKMSKAFDTFQNFWTPIFALLVISAIGFFISGISDKDIISYSILIVVSVLILFNSWRAEHFENKHEPHGKVNPLLKPFLIIFKFLIATIPQVICVIQLIVIIVIFSKYQHIIYDKNRTVPDVFQSFNWGLFIVMLGQIGLINWYLQKNIGVEKSFFQTTFLPIFAIVATISTALMVELYVIIKHFLTDG